MDVTPIGEGYSRYLEKGTLAEDTAKTKALDWDYARWFKSWQGDQDSWSRVRREQKAKVGGSWGSQMAPGPVEHHFGFHHVLPQVK